MAPVPNPTDETSVLMSPLELCPMEVWYNEIFPYLHTVDDRIALYNTCKLFRNLLEGSKNLWIFPAILPNLYKYLDNNSALTVRRVCKKWSKSLDEHLDSFYKNEFTNFDEVSKTFKSDSYQEPGYVLDDVTEVRALLQKVRNVENPMTWLPGGKLVASLLYDHVFDGDDDDNGADDMPEIVVEFLSGLVAILEAVGRSIRYLNLTLSVMVTFNQERFRPVDGWLYSHLLQCLVAVPNVRFLKLAVEAEILYLNDNVTRDIQFIEMVEALIMNPLPLTPRLQYFEPVFLHSGDERVPIVDHLFEHYNSAPIKRIKWKGFGVNDPVHDPPRESLATLKELYYCDINHGESIRQFPAPQLTTLRLRLVSFDMEFAQNPAIGPVDVTKVLESLNKLFPSLENLSIECTRRHGLLQFSPLPGNITFPRMTTLRLATSGVISYDILRCFPSLERFYVVNNRITFGPQQLPLTEAQHEAANWFDWERLEHSRSWVALPSLKIISFKLVQGFFDFALYQRNTLETRECRRSLLVHQ